MKKERALELIVESFETVKKMGMIGGDANIDSETLLLGISSPLDSIGFIAFLTDLEERVTNETKKDLYLVLNEIIDFNINNPHLSVDALAKYIVKLSGV